MNILFNRLSDADHTAAVSYYKAISKKLADGFDQELQVILDRIKDNPERYHFTRCKSYRRANFSRFPYHLLYRVYPEKNFVRIMVIRHDHQDPAFGLERE